MAVSRYQASSGREQGLDPRVVRSPFWCRDKGARMNAPRPPSRSRHRLEPLDLLRFFAAVSVVLYHYFFRGWQHREFFAVSFSGFGDEFRFGYLGVELFFVVSGLVILMRCEGRLPRDFIQSRITRLYPDYVLEVLLQR